MSEYIVTFRAPNPTNVPLESYVGVRCRVEDLGKFHDVLGRGVRELAKIGVKPRDVKYKIEPLFPDSVTVSPNAGAAGRTGQAPDWFTLKMSDFRPRSEDSYVSPAGQGTEVWVSCRRDGVRYVARTRVPESVTEDDFSAALQWLADETGVSFRFTAYSPGFGPWAPAVLA